ncbi:BTAD domain-containing putative transcriptional regulator [Nocardia cyriacigeorgica]|uniref:BTAD domain-containing putative transcriptional regulator n=1 Tax=Nocardia cyriacigeorgica TaxID=135487 RepID=UPI0024559427|nr:BTAD domain-containing putative transcriptional regulator [Nocardia cyriacigeorgica]
MRIAVLGPLAVHTADGEPIDIGGIRLRMLLARLALEGGRAVSVDGLIDGLWGAEPPADAAGALQASVSRLRKALPEPGAVELVAGGYRLGVQAEDVDAFRFEELLGRGRRELAAGKPEAAADTLDAALALWRGPALADLLAAPFAELGASRLNELRAAAEEARFDALLQAGRHSEILADLESAGARRPLSERLAVLRIRALAASGRQSDALAVYERVRESLGEELGVDPSAELQRAHLALLRGELHRPVTRPAPATSRIPLRLTSFVGRERELERLALRLSDSRLITLTGPGGAGKTRLAVEAVARHRAAERGRVWFVPLAGVSDADEVIAALLGAVGARDARGPEGAGATPLTRVIESLDLGEAIVVLDNCEHVIEAAAAFAHRVLGECTRLRILATSREPLGITGEALWQVEPLALPAATADAAVIADSPAVALLRDRASAVRQDLGTDPATLATMARICRALDGIPLAIELAAARLRTMSLDQLAHRLDDRFRLLTGGSRTAIRQHRTLRAVVDWSWELLSDAERLVLARLAVFAGGASLEAAEQVCADGSTVEQWQVLELLTSLTEKSLLITTDDGLRFRMLETIKQYAADRLAESGDAEAARRAHLTYFTGLAATAEPHLRRAEQLEWLAVLEAEHDNIAAAMRGALASEDTPAAMALAAAAGWYWWLGGHKGEGTELVIAAAELPGEVDDETRAMVYGLVVHFVSSGRNDEQQIAEWIRKAHRFGRDVQGGHPALRFTAALDRMLQGPDEYLPAFESLLDDEEPWVRALARLQLGKLRTVLGHQGQEADEYLAQALTEFRALGERWGMSFALTELANRTAQRGELLRAVELFDEAIAVVTEVGALEDVVAMRARQALLHWVLGDPDASAAALAEAQRCADQNGWPTALAEVALARAELARLGDDRALAHQQIDLARALLAADAEQPNVAATVHILLAYLTDDRTEAATHCDAAYQAASAAGHALLTAHVLIGIADLAVRDDQYDQATRLLAAASTVRGLPDHSHPDAARIEQKARNHLGDTAFDQATREGAKADPHELVAQALGH